ncbi:hypothetical protein [Vibrio mangrovi]|uniref:Uncharacterized protein n=1 Tax=Vibrio mangrovi TaxID=474394 RepID=A0A1Y6IVE5_9VIBR|nr:hypothetical protein [Vibrio mangrovi]MDW6002250.1 hypothetical protein [Vibrio mangrovi]SMS01596.1 hypothetical protein VIM7927_02893 [Vibrio mangrovi]
MNQLFTYISAIRQESGALIAGQQLYQDVTEEDGVLVENSELIVTFHNGVIMKQSIESEHQEEPTDLACAECWISYEIISEPEGLRITPKRKTFINTCQEAFWLKINAVQSATDER